MKKMLLALALGSLSATVFAADNCEEIKGQIETKIKSMGVPLYKLQIVDANVEVGGKVVGTCQAGTKKIVYWRLSQGDK
jgi:hypothetical protein